MAGVQIGALHVSLSADSAAFDQNMQQAQQTADDAMSQITASAKKMAVVLAGVFAANHVKDAIKQQIDYADVIHKASIRTAQSAEALSAMNYALGFSDTNLEDYSKGLQKLSQNMVAANEGSKEQERLFKALNISVLDAQGKYRDAAEVMLDVSDAMYNMEDGTLKNTIAQDLLGKAGVSLIPHLNQGADAIRGLTKEAETFNQVVTQDAANAAAQFNDDMSRLKSATDGMWKTMTNQLMPSLSSMSQHMVAGAKDTQILEAAAFGVANGLKGIYTAVQLPIIGIKLLGEGIGKVAAIAASVASGDFAQAKEIWQDNSTADKTLDSLMSLGKIWTETGQNAIVSAQNQAAASDDIAKKSQETLRIQAALAENSKKTEELSKKAAEALKKQQAAVDKLAQSFMTEAEKENFFYEQQKNFLENANAKAFESANQRHQLLQQLETQHHQKIKEINDKAAADAQAKAIADANQRVAELLEDPIVTDIAYEAKVQNDDYKAQQENIDLNDALDVEENAKNAYKLAMQDDFIASFLTGEQDRINQAITMGDKELEARKAQMQATVGFFNQGLAQMAQGQGKAAKAAQAIQKAQALYEIGVNTYRAAMGAYAALSPIPFVGPALGVAAAAAAIAFGGSMAQGVLSGGGSPSVTGGAPPALPASSSPTSQAEQRAEQPPPTITYLRVAENDILLGRTLLDLVETTLADNGGKIENLRIIPA